MVAIREVLCATKLEHPADAALRYSFFVAEQFRCPLHVLHASDVDGASPPNTYLSSMKRMAQVLATHRLRERLDEVVRAVPASEAARATSHVAEGSWTEALLAFSERQRADVIVLGSSLEDGAGHATNAAPIDHFAERTPSPLLTVPDAELGAPQIRRVLLAVDANATTGSLIEWATLWAHRFGAAVSLFYCDPSPSDVGMPRARWQHEVEAKLRNAGVEVTDHLTGPRIGLADRVLTQASLAASDLIMLSAKLCDENDGRVVGPIRRRSALPVLSVHHAPPDRLFLDPALDAEAIAANSAPCSASAAFGAEPYPPRVHLSHGVRLAS